MDSNNIKKTFDSISNDNSTEVKFYVSNQYDSTSVRKAGDLTVVLTEETTPFTSIWLKDRHIASGFGFDTLADKLAVKELLENPSLKELIENNTTPEVDPSQEEDEPIEIQDSTIYLDNKCIKFEDGILKGRAWIDIKDLKFNTIDGLTIYPDEEIVLPVYDSLNINSVEFKYTYTTETGVPEDLEYLFYVSDYDNINESTLINENRYTSIQTDSINSTGVLSALRLNLDKEISKTHFDNANFIETKYIYFSIRDSRKEKITYKKVFKVTFKYPIFKLDTYDSSTFDEVGLDEYSDLNLYVNTNRISFTFDGFLSNESGETSKHYIAVPTAISEKVNIILKKSNISGNFNKKFQGKLDGYDYTIFESRYGYYGIVTWILEIDLD